jgi:hypothetical protein
MKPRGSWYFDGYQRVTRPKKNGEGTCQVLVYTGEYYGFPGGGQELGQMKKRATILTVISLICYFVAQFFPSDGGMNRLVALPGILALVPMIFVVMGLGNFLLAKEKWEIRVYYAGYRRLTRWGIGQAVLLGLWALAELVYLVLHFSQIGGEVVYFLLALLSLGANLRLLYLVRQHPAQVVEGPEVK